MKKLAAYYFSGTGNTEYVVKKLCSELKSKYEVKVYDICKVDRVEESDTYILAYPIYGSCPPIPMRRFLHGNADKFRGKEMIIVATQYLFSGDGAATIGRTAEKLGAKVTHAEHIRMPNNISDVKGVPVKNGKALDDIIKAADAKIARLANDILSGNGYRRGFGVFSHALGYFSQRVFFRMNEESKRDALTIRNERCSACGLCAKNCPVGNLDIRDGRVTPKGECVLCYRCVNLCPNCAISLVGKRPPEVQYKGVPKVR